MKRIRISKSKKNPVFDCIFSFDDNTLQEVTHKFEELNLLFESPKFSYNFDILIFISAIDEEVPLTLHEQLAFCLL